MGHRDTVEQFRLHLAQTPWEGENRQAGGAGGHRRPRACRPPRPDRPGPTPSFSTASSIASGSGAMRATSDRRTATSKDMPARARAVARKSADTGLKLGAADEGELHAATRRPRQHARHAGAKRHPPRPASRRTDAGAWRPARRPPAPRPDAPRSAPQAACRRPGASARHRCPRTSSHGTSCIRNAAFHAARSSSAHSARLPIPPKITASQSHQIPPHDQANADVCDSQVIGVPFPRCSMARWMQAGAIARCPCSISGRVAHVALFAGMGGAGGPVTRCRSRRGDPAPQPRLPATRCS